MRGGAPRRIKTLLVAQASQPVRAIFKRGAGCLTRLTDPNPVIAPTWKAETLAKKSRVIERRACPERPAADPDAVVCVKVRTRSSRPGIGPRRDDEWVVQVSAPPVEGAANQAVTAVLASAMAVAPSRLSLVSGAASTHKRFRVSGLSEGQVEERLARAANGR